MEPNEHFQSDPSVTIDQLRHLASRAQTGDVAALAQLREYLQQTGLWQTLGDLTRVVEEELLKLACGEDPLARESIKQKVQELKAELTEAAPPTAMGRLLVEQVAIDWLRLRVAELEAMTTGK